MFILIGTFLVSSFTTGAQGIFDPLSLYIDAPQGFALSHIDSEKGTVYDMFSWHHSTTMFGHHDDDFEDYQMKTHMNKMLLMQTGAEDSTYYVDIWYYDGHDIEHGNDDVEKVADTGRWFRSVPHDDGSIALQCANNKYLRWESEWSYRRPTSSPSIKDPCTSQGICENCKFYPEIGSLHPVSIEIVSVDWGTVSDDIIENPSVIARDQQDNYSDQIVSSTYHVTYTDATTDTTTWSETWGFSYTTSIKTQIFCFQTSFSATTSYQGTNGGSNTITESTSYDKMATYPCPGKHKCFYNLIGRHLSDASIPFTATVRITDGTNVEEKKEQGVWKGVKVYDTFAEFCTEDMVTGETNCPHEFRVPVIGKRQKNPSSVKE